jgi:tRNA threonylcarbamoyladenosine dehydratase
VRHRGAKSAQQRKDDVLIAEQLSRNTMFYGEENQKKVAQSFVIVVGLGGVGSHAAHMLARSGVGKLRLVDFDQVTLSSLNRHAVATRDDVGRPKVVVCAERFADFNPCCEVEPVASMFTAADADALLAGAPAYVVDCIDDISTKTDLLQACQRLGLPVISALGAGGKVDPTRILIGQLADAVCLCLFPRFFFFALEGGIERQGCRN